MGKMSKLIALVIFSCFGISYGAEYDIKTITSIMDAYEKQIDSIKLKYSYETFADKEGNREFVKGTFAQKKSEGYVLLDEITQKGKAWDNDKEPEGIARSYNGEITRYLEHEKNKNGYHMAALHEVHNPNLYKTRENPYYRVWHINYKNKFTDLLNDPNGMATIQGQELINGLKAIKINFKAFNGYYDFYLWLLPEKNYLPIKFESYRTTDGSRQQEMHWSDFKEFAGGIWYPMNIKMYLRDVNEPVTFKIEEMDISPLAKEDFEFKFPAFTHVTDHLIGTSYLTTTTNEKDECVWHKMLLTKGWAIQSSDKVKHSGDIVSTGKFKSDGWYPASVPSTVLAVLCENGVFPDPYFGENLRKIPGYQNGIWFSMPDNSPFRIPYWYRTEFRLPQKYVGKKIWLHFDGINYKANIWLNGKRIADSSTVVGMFRRFAFDVTENITPGTNYLAVQITAPGQSHGKNNKETDMECTSSWDDHCPYPPDGNMGIWRDVYIKVTGPVTITHPNVVAKLDLPSADVAHLRISGQINNTSNKQITGILRAVISDVNNIAQGGTSKDQGRKIVVYQTITIKPSEAKEIEFSPNKFSELNISNARLWWPNPLGPQNLYNLRLEFEIDGEISDSTTINFGVHQITTYLNKQGWRVIQLNGQNILGRGGTWMTSDLLLRFSSKRYESMLRYAKEMNWNLMRVEGYSIKELPEFYDMCDKFGIMIAPEIFARNTRDPKLQLECFKDHLLEIRHHPCIIHFIGHDETTPSRDIDTGYRKLIAKLAPHITYQAGSGGPAESRADMGGTRTGGPWNFSPPSYYYGQDSNTDWTIQKRTYASGATYSGGIGGEVALAENFHKFLPESDVWPPSMSAWRFHTICTGTWLDGDEENKLVPSFTRLLNRRYGEPKNIDEFSYKAQIMTMEAMRALHEVVGRNKYDCTFLLTWKFNAPWPTTLSWNVVDWYLAPTGAYYGTKKACEPLHIQYSYDNTTIYVINNYYQNFKELKATADLYDLDMTKRYSRTATTDIPPDSSNKIFTIERPKGLKQTYFLKLELKDSSDNLLSSNFYWLSTKPDPAAEFTDLNELPEVDLEIFCTTEKKNDTCCVYIDLQNPSSTLAFAVNPKIKKSISDDLILPIYWEDNYFSLLPGEKRRVKVEFDIKDIGTEEPSLSINGWNVKSEETKLTINP